MNYIDALLERQTALAMQLASSGETSLSLAQAAAVFTAPQRAEAADEAGAPYGADLHDAAGAHDARAQEAEKEGGAQALGAAFAGLAGQPAPAAGGRQVAPPAGPPAQPAAPRPETRPRAPARPPERQRTLLSARTPQNSPAGLTGRYEQLLSVAGPAAAPTQKSMAEISRFFERDARRYG